MEGAACWRPSKQEAACTRTHVALGVVKLMVLGAAASRPSLMMPTTLAMYCRGEGMEEP